MTDLSYAQLEGVWLQAAAGTKYATQSWAALMAAIAEAESGGNPVALNPTDNNGTQTSWGLWQISTGTHAEPSPNWNNPLTNAQLAIQKLDTQGLGAWGTYDSGAYKAFLSGSTTPDTSGLPPDSTTSGATAAVLTAAQAGTASQTCAWSVGWGGIPGTSWLSWILTLGNSKGNVAAGQVCLISKTQVRAIYGAMLVLGGSAFVAAGLGLIAAEAGLAVGGKITELALVRLIARGAGNAAVGSARSSGGGFDAASFDSGARQARGDYGRGPGSGSGRSYANAQARNDERTAREVTSRRRDSARGPALRDEEPAPF